MVVVVCAIILKEDKVFVTQRSEKMSLPLKWEFPGGKLAANESEEAGLHREIREELNISISILSRLTSNIHSYDNITIDLVAYVANYVDGEIKLSEHKDGRWFDNGELVKLDWAEADIPILNKFLAEYQ